MEQEVGKVVVEITDSNVDESAAGNTAGDVDITPVLKSEGGRVYYGR